VAFRGVVKVLGRGIARVVVFVNMKWIAVLANAERGGAPLMILGEIGGV